MCIIAVKIKGTDFPSPQIIANCIEANPDGFSMAWNEDGAVHNDRTMSPDEALAKYTELSSRLDPATTGFMFHARWATHGSKRLDNCHCWIIDGRAFAHNGVMSNMDVHDDMTDSEVFFREYFAPVLKGCGAKTASRIASKLIGASRIAGLNASGDFLMLGHWEKDCEQGRKGFVYYSSYSYKKAWNDYRSAVAASAYSCGCRPTAAKPAKAKDAPKTKDGSRRKVDYPGAAKARAAGELFANLP